MYILGNKFNSKAQQIDQNTEDIAKLKEIVKTPAIIYDANIEISIDAGTVNTSNIVQTIESIDNAFVLDTKGSLFRIIEIVDTTIYIMYASTIRGEKGDQGEQGETGEQGEPGETINPYPVNSIYLSVVDTNPSILFGGTWEQLKDKFLLGAGDTYNNGDTGGSNTHKHNLSNNGYAKISLTFSGQARIMENKKSVSGYSSNTQTTSTINYDEGSYTSYDATTLGGYTDNTEALPPYLVVYMWKRIA